MANETPRRQTKAATGNSDGFPGSVFQDFNAHTAQWDPNNALALAWASSLAYQDDRIIQSVAANWTFHTRPTIAGPRDIQALVIGNDSLIIIIFRGTINEKDGRVDANNWIVNLDARQISVDSAFHTDGRIHDGFARAFSTVWPGIQDAIKKLQSDVQSKAQSLWITGHSLGGALALLAAAACTFSDQRIPFNGLYTFGQPRVGNPAFCGNCDTHFGDQYFRFVNNEDIVTRVPPRFFPHFPRPDIYAHGGQLRYFDNLGGLHRDEHYWNTFLANVEVGFEKLMELPGLGPIGDHKIKSGYIDHIQGYIDGGCRPPMS